MVNAGQAGPFTCRVLLFDGIIRLVQPCRVNGPQLPLSPFVPAVIDARSLLSAALACCWPPGALLDRAS